jgi:ABC-type sulfate transport system permease component
MCSRLWRRLPTRTLLLLLLVPLWCLTALRPGRGGWFFFWRCWYLRRFSIALLTTSSSALSRSCAFLLALHLSLQMTKHGDKFVISNHK